MGPAICRREPAQTVTASLIIAPQWIGDAVMTEPLLRRLHARGERLTVAALPWVAPVFRAMPQVAHILPVPFAHGGLQFRARRQVARELRGRFDSAYILPNSLKSALVPWWAEIPRRVGYLGEARVGVLTHRLKNPPKGRRPPMVALYSALSGDTDVAGDRPQLSWPQAEREATLNALGVQAGQYLVFAPGAEYGPAKRWPAAHFAELARRFAADGYAVWLFGSPKDHAVAEEIGQLAPGLTHNLCGATSLDEAIALIAGADAVVSNDSGLMHVAAALRRPQVAVFGSSDPRHTPPRSPLARIASLEMPCSPCFARECPLGHTDCLNRLSPAAVFDSLRLALRPQTERPPR